MAELQPATSLTDPSAHEAQQNPDAEMTEAQSVLITQPQPTAADAAAVPDRPLNVKDALSYLDAVKTQFHDRPDVYNLFLDIMKDFKGQVIDTPGVIERVSNLFQGHAILIGEFNTFLPAGYRIAVTEDPNNKNANSIRVSTPAGTTTHTTVYRTGPGTGPPTTPQPQDMQSALDYVQKIKTRYADEPDRYKKFLEILSGRHPSGIKHAELVSRGAELFKDAPDLMDGLRSFLRDAGSVPLEESANLDIKGKKKPAAASGSTLPQKRKRKAADKEKDATWTGKSGSNKRQKHRRLDDISRQSVHEENPYDENHFFERVRRHLDSQDTYNEFLKLINLFTQDFIDSTRLLKECRTYLGEGELLMQLKAILGWDDRRELYAMDDHFWPASGNKPTKLRQPKSNATFGSYMRLPAHEINVTCSGRDEMCKSVLNDEWISRPTFASEDYGFVAHKKNVYEEALHRSEEERHEYDFHIEAIVKTISLLDPINIKIAQLNPEERGHFKLKPNFGGVGKSIHHRVIRKIYGREAGEEIIRAMQDSPALAIPVVLTRLKQKEEEWKRAQREWNKVWREVDARNYYKSLDHQGITFKAADKKAITAKAFVSQIEAARAEQVAKRASYIDPLFGRTRACHQLEFMMDNVSVLQDSLKLIFSFLDRTTGQLSQGERKRVEGFLRTFTPLFFTLDQSSFNVAFSAFQELGDSEMSDELASGAEEESLNLASGSKNGRGGRKSATNGTSGDLRKKLLKSGQAKWKNRSTRNQGQTSPSVSRAPSPEDNVQQRADGRMPRRSAFFCNTTIYVLLRLLELFYSRLLVFKNLSVKLSQAPPQKFNSIANGLGLTNEDQRFQNAAHFYDFLLESCEKLFDNEIDVPLFEDQMRYMFGPKEAYKIFTVDKLIGAIIKQVQCVFSDTKSQDLYNLLKKEREDASPGPQEAGYRKDAEKIVGDTEHLFHINWIPELKVMTMQLLGKDDPTRDEPEMFVERWQLYIDSFTSTSATQGIVSSKLRRPFLRRNLLPSKEKTSDLVSGGALEMKICVRTYRVFYVSRTGDYLWRTHRSISPTSKRTKGSWYQRLQDEMVT